jgi:hypothetical protein
MMTQSINPSEYPNEPEEVIVRGHDEKEEDAAARMA